MNTPTTPTIRELEIELALTRQASEAARRRMTEIADRVAKLEGDLSEARRPKPLVIPTSWNACGPANVWVDSAFDRAGDLCIAVTDKKGTGEDYTARTWVNRDGAQAIIDHLTRLLNT